jgi:alpha-glucosidase
MKQIKKIVVAFLIMLVSISVKAQNYSLSNPNKSILVSINVDDDITFSVAHQGKEVIKNAQIALDIEGYDVLGKHAKVKKVKTRSHDAFVTPVVPQKKAKIKDEYQELTIHFKKKYKIIFRAYNDGIAYRFSTALKKDIVVNNEILQLNYANATTSLFPKEETLLSHYERYYIPTKLDTLKQASFCSLPVLTKTNNVNVVFTEADVYDYPGMFMYGTKQNALKAGFPKYVVKALPKPGAEDRDQLVETANYIAKTKGTRDFPWRTFVISDQDKDLVASNLVFLLSSSLKLEHPNWIKPGKVAWDWYNANNIYGVNFKAGINNDTYKYYIDFASKHGLEYIILDEGWSKSTTNIKACNPDIDVEALVKYGKERNVGVILWVLWSPLDQNMDALELYKHWGVKGVKVDFMQRADQYIVNYYERVAKAAAKNHLIVDFHGSYKPSGLRRAYPNVLTYEGVKGNENNKWSDGITPNHNLTLPFTRMVAGPMDFTPGSMVNATKENFRISFDRPMSFGTRAHQVAMYVVFESPLQMLCESPSTYYKEAETTKFISKIPSVWHDTKVLEAKISDYIVVARKHKNNWFLGAMTDEASRTFQVDLSFLDEGSYTIEIIEDGLNTNRYAQDYIYQKKTVTKTDKLTIALAESGGYTAIFTKQ